MYFFLDNRLKHLGSRMKQAEPGINGFKVFKKKVKTDLMKSNPTLFNELEKTAQQLSENLESHNHSNNLLKVKTKTVSSLLSSFFLPWTKEYQLREESGKFLAKSESKFNKITKLAHKLSNIYYIHH